MIGHNTITKKWPIRKLGKVVEFLDSQRIPVKASERIPGPYPYYGANGQQDSVNDYIFDEPTVLLAEDGGHFGDPNRPIAYSVSGKYWVNNHAHVLRPGPEVELRYLTRLLENYDVTPFITGTTRAKLNQRSARDIPIPLPPLAEQQRIAAILDKADALRAKRRAALAKLDTLLQSTFLDMFGDPVTNPMNWEICELGECLEFITSGSRGWAKYYSENGTRFIRSLDVRMNYISDEDSVYVNAPDTAEAKRTCVQANDVLLTITGSRIGRVAVVPKGFEDANISQHVAILRIDTSKIRPRYVSMFLSLHSGGQRQIHQLAYGQTKPGLNFKQIRSFRIPNPPLEKQDRFLTFWNEFGNQVKKEQEANLFLNNLFYSLQQRAFKGKL